MARKNKSRTFINFVNKKYASEFSRPLRSHMWNYYDDYACWLYFDKCKENYEEYYFLAENDWKEYSDMQTGIEKDEQDTSS